MFIETARSEKQVMHIFTVDPFCKQQRFILKTKNEKKKKKNIT